MIPINDSQIILHIYDLLFTPSNITGNMIVCFHLFVIHVSTQNMSFCNLCSFASVCQANVFVTTLAPVPRIAF